MNWLLVMIIGCIGFGSFAIGKRTLPIGPRRKVIDRPAILLGVSLIALPFLNASILFAARWVATTRFPDSKMLAHWSLMGPLILFPLSIAGCLIAAKRWSVPKYYEGDWDGYTPFRPEDPLPDFSIFDSSNSDDQCERQP